MTTIFCASPLPNQGKTYSLLMLLLVTLQPIFLIFKIFKDWDNYQGS